MAQLGTVAGVDIGGTKILAAIVNRRGKLLAREYSPTPADAGPETGIQHIVQVVEAACIQADVPARGGLVGLGIAVAGLVDTPHGVLVTSPHLPAWRGVHLKERLEAALGVRTFLLNDANAAALGEQKYGAGRGVRNQLYITVSTGIGGGIIIDGRLYVGSYGTAGEIGHMVIDANGPPCHCGNNGCLESLASGTAVAREMSQRLASGVPSMVLEMVAGNLHDITALVVAQAAERGDALAQEVIHQAGVYLGVGLANLVNIFNPELIILGGGLIKIGHRLLGPAISEMKRRAFALPASQVRLVPAALGDNSGVMGAVAYVLQEIKRS